MMSSIRENVAIHDPEEYEDIILDALGNPHCPVCNSPMRPSSDRESNNMWRCPNSRREGEYFVCDFIEGKFSRRRRLLWDCRYEPRNILCD
jgi:hypothetical protein